MPLFHLTIQALFKSMIFLCGGGLIYLSLINQDIRKYGNNLNLCPVESLILLIFLIRLCDFHFLAEFYSKDLIIELF